jgi:hypothetical protein
MSRRKLPQRGTEEYDWLVALAALTVCQDWGAALCMAVYDYFVENRGWRIGRHRYGFEHDPQWHYDFVYDLVDYIIEKPLTRWPDAEELK